MAGFPLPEESRPESKAKGLRSPPRSEQQLQTELRLPRAAAYRGADQRSDLAGGRAERARVIGLGRSGVEHSGRREVEVRMVEDVEQLGAELNADPFVDLRILHDSKVRVREAWPN